MRETSLAEDGERLTHTQVESMSTEQSPSYAAPNHVAFFDTTLRDGEQSPGCSMTTQEKLTMAHALEDLGVDIIEAGFAMASEGDFAAISTITQAIRKPKIASLARAKQEDIEIAARAIQFADRPRIHVFLASSDLHLEYKLKIGRQEALDRTGESVRLARSFVDDVEFSPEAATRSDRDFLVEMVRIAVEAGATTINMPDTVGYTTPEEYGAMFREVRERIPAIDKEGIILSSHCHDDLGLAVANSLAAIQAGARQVECTVNGIGERAGNAALEEIAAALYVRGDHYGVTTNIKLNQLYATSQVLGQLITFRPSPNKAIVGANAFAHESGIHQHGMLANPLCYEIMTPDLVGVSKTHLVLGKHSGRAALRHRLEQLGFTLSRDELQHTYYRFVALADRKKNIYDQDLIGILPDQIRERRHEPVAELD
jgi:2-isopropylmalate synthase